MPATWPTSLLAFDCGFLTVPPLATFSAPTIGAVAKPLLATVPAWRQRTTCLPGGRSFGARKTQRNLPSPSVGSRPAKTQPVPAARISQAMDRLPAQPVPRTPTKPGAVLVLMLG